ncbi:MAG: energy transducer TonB [Candidatus Melainabacteria bacterium]|nr:energy transducer TonB [Candidatus Melainabacteria bacterium]MBI3308770.1 energy transducer TonB [Candidatus Melainabacteria bacterium]
MNSTLFKQRKRTKILDPIIVATYSIIPGLGQLYNGKTKKGMLFLVASFISLLMLLASINPSSALEFSLIILTIVKFFVGFIFHFELEPSPAAEFLMNTIKFGGSFSTSLIVTIVGFVIYSMVDAYLDAQKAQERLEQNFISTDSTMFRFSESTASSYIVHTLIFSMLFLISLYLVIPTNKEQVTEIEFIMPQIESKKPPPPETTRRSTVQSVDQGKHDPTKEITPPQMSRPAAPPPRPQPKVVEKVTPPKPVEPPKPKAAPKPLPKISDVPALKPAKPQPAPIAQAETSQNLPKPAPITNPSPSFTSSTMAVAIVPRVPGVPGTGGLGNAGNPPPNSDPNAPSSIAAKKDIDFGPYMEELQRRIKREWKPPRGNESKRVVVVFKLTKAGELSNLSIKQGSGFIPADDAALLAVREASPFARLPEGAPSLVDIEFTFDYNVFGSKDSYRKY